MLQATVECHVAKTRGAGVIEAQAEVAHAETGDDSVGLQLLLGHGLRWCALWRLDVSYNQDFEKC